MGTYLPAPATGEANLLQERPTRVTDQVAKLIRERIWKGAHHPGDRLVEMVLARQFGVGQNVVREALIVLEHQGYVQRFPRKGTYVISLDDNDVVKLYEVRTPWELLVADLIMARMKTETLDFSLAERAIAGMHDAVKREAFQTLTDWDLEFHRTLWRLADNKYLYDALERVSTPLMAFTTIQELTTPQELAPHEQSVVDHEALLAAVKACSREQVRHALFLQQEHSIKWRPFGRHGKK